MKFQLSAFLLLIYMYAGAQNFSLQISSADKSASFFTKKFSFKTQVKDSIAANKEISDLMNALREGGYAAASVDSTMVDSLQIHSYIYVGEKFQLLKVANGNLDEALIADAGLKNYLLN